MQMMGATGMLWGCGLPSRQIEEVLEEALNNGKLTLIECVISKKELVYPVVPNGMGLHEMIHYPGIEGEEDE